jgi:hypothetical protein
MGQLLGIGDGAGKVVLQLKPTATAAAAEIVDQYGWAVQVTPSWHSPRGQVMLGTLASRRYRA